jgi:hypothetical protein
VIIESDSFESSDRSIRAREVEYSGLPFKALSCLTVAFFRTNLSSAAVRPNQVSRGAEEVKKYKDKSTYKYWSPHFA